MSGHDPDDLTAPPRVRLVESDNGYHIVDITVRVAIVTHDPPGFNLAVPTGLPRFTGLMGMSLASGDDCDDPWLGYIAQDPSGRLTADLRETDGPPGTHDFGLGYPFEDGAERARAFRAALVDALNTAIFDAPVTAEEATRAAVCAGVAQVLASLAAGDAAVSVAELRRVAEAHQREAEVIAEKAHTGRGPHAGSA